MDVPWSDIAKDVSFWSSVISGGIGALIGAAVSFFLLVAWEKRKARAEKEGHLKQLRYEVLHAMVNADNKKSAIEALQFCWRKGHEVAPLDLDPFNIQYIGSLMATVRTELGPLQNRLIDLIVYRMAHVDMEIGAASSTVEHFLKARLLNQHDDTQMNGLAAECSRIEQKISQLQDLMDAYVKGEYLAGIDKSKTYKLKEQQVKMRQEAQALASAAFLEQR